MAQHSRPSLPGIDNGCSPRESLSLMPAGDIVKMPLAYLFRPRNTLLECARRRIDGESIKNVSAALERAGFSAAGYRATNEDLIRADLDEKAALLHFITYCGDELRHFPIDLLVDGLIPICELHTPNAFKASAVMALVNAYCVPSSRIWTSPLPEQQRFWTHLLRIMSFIGTPYFVIGDSHSNAYMRLIPQNDRHMIPIHILCSGCSGLGLGNPSSRSGAGSRLIGFESALPQDDIEILFKFGQVDVEFVFTFLRIKSGQHTFQEEKFRSFCERSTDCYFQFLSKHFSNRSATVASIFPPTLSDDAWRNGYANAQIVENETSQPLAAIIEGIRTLEIPRLIDRTRHHALYNLFLRMKSARAGFAFLDDFTHFLGSDDVVNPIYIPSHNGSDHHLELQPITEKLKAVAGRHFEAKMQKDSLRQPAHS